jgi:hypothetical protein
VFHHNIMWCNDDLFSTVPNGETGGIENDMPFNQLSWSKILESGKTNRSMMSLYHNLYLEEKREKSKNKIRIES